MKRFVSTLFAVFALLVLLPTAARAQEYTQGTVNTTGNFLFSTEEIELGGDISDSGTTQFKHRNNVLDLKGHTLTVTKLYLGGEASKTLTVKDSVGGGKIVATDTIEISGSGTLKAHGGTIEGAVTNSGTITVDSGATGATFTGAVTNEWNATISGGTFNGEVTNEWKGTISSGTFNGVVTNEGTIENGTFSASGSVVTRDGSSKISGGTFNGEVVSYGYSEYSTSEISGGTFKKKVTLGQSHDEQNSSYNPSQIGHYGVVEVTGGEFYGEVVITPNTSTSEQEAKNTISGGWFYHSEPTGDALEYDSGAVKITYKSKNGTFFAMNVQMLPSDGSGVLPDVDYIPEGKTVNTFDCWYTDDACTTKFAAETGHVTTDTTLYGKAKSNDENDKEPEDDPWDNPFVDVHDYDWFYGSVKYVHKRGWFTGKTATLYAPYDTFTRAEISAVLYNRAGKPTVDISRALYLDVTKDAWYTRAIYWMTDQGNAAGAGHGMFYPNQPVTREEMATMLYNAAGSPETNGTLFQYLDKDEASDWAVDALRWAVAKGIMIGNGDGTLNPTGYTTRAEAASIMKSFGSAGY